MKQISKSRSRTKTLSSEEIENTAKLANINITQKEQYKYSIELTKIINYNIDHLNKIYTDKVIPTAHAVGEKSVTRDDKTGIGLDDSEATKNASETHNKFFKVKRIIGDE